MNRVLAFLLLWCIPAFAWPQDIPRLSVELQETETVVGQPLIVRIKVLVPTFSPKPPEFPSLEVPGLIVRLPERASGPISETVDGETWSGVQRSYRVYPLQPGRFEIPAQTVRVTYAETGGIDPVSVDLSTDAIAFDATVPSGAADLSPLIVANDFSLNQTLEITDNISVGDAVERTVEASISGTTAVLIPPLIATTAINALRPYPKEPRVNETEDRGVLSGQRVESTTYLAVSAGDVQLPAITIDWFNLETGQVETAELGGATFSVSGEALAAEGNRPNWARVAGLLAGLALIVWVGFRLWPYGKLYALKLQNQWQSSEIYASRIVRAAIRQKDLSSTYDALQYWSGHLPQASLHELNEALQDVGGTRYGRESGHPEAAWRNLRVQFDTFRKRCIAENRQRQNQDVLPPMNPLS